MYRVLENAKPCLMCGCKEFLLEEPIYDKIFTVSISCSKCGLNGYKNYFHTAKDPIETIIEYWNIRGGVNL